MKKRNSIQGLKYAITEVLQRRNLKEVRIEGTNIIILSQGTHRELWIKEFSSLVPYNIGLLLGNKNYVREILKHNNIITAPGASFDPRSEHEAALYAQSIGFPVILRQENAWRAEPAITNLRSLSAVKLAFRTLAELGESILVEKHVRGPEYRIAITDTGYINVCRRRSVTTPWRGVSAREASPWRRIGRKVLQSFPGLRLAIFQCTKDYASKKIYPTDFFTALGASSEFLFCRENEKITAAELFINMIFSGPKI